MTNHGAVQNKASGAAADAAKGLLLGILQAPRKMRDLDIAGWNRVLYEAHMLKLRGRLAHDARAHGLWDALPEKVRQILINAEIEAAARQRKIMWEVNRVRRALFGFHDKVILVKGGAYIAKDMKGAQGRTSADIDILVAKKNLDIVENHLFMAGYGSQIQNEYDQKYYREWAHELPPLVHPDRMVEVDVHHNILQVTSRYKPDIERMIADSVPLEDNIHVLCNEDMLLHSILHQFVDGALKASLRNLLEQDDMIREFARDPDFWPRFMDRAAEMNLGRPVFYALRYCRDFLKTEVPQEVWARANRHAPGALTLWLMDRMVRRVMIPYGAKGSRLTSYLATNGLYLRAHWLRMPAWMLLRHLTVKFFRRFRVEKS